MNRGTRWLLALLLALLTGGSSFAQSVNAGDIRGTITDSTGAVVAGVSVTVLNVDTGVSKQFVTNDAGVYDTNSIVPGHYTVTFTRDGFEKMVRGPITLEVGFTTVNGQLQIGSTSEQVTVTGDVPLLQTESGEHSDTLTSKEMTELPQVTQNWENFMVLLPGASGTAGNSNPGQTVAINGNLPYSNILADGASTTLSHSQNANPAVFETVDELQVSASSFSAQYGVGGLVINQITKGGTNRFHGSAYEYLQNDAFNARNYEFGHTSADLGRMPAQRYHNFGGTIGGPIIRNKAFFFFDIDRTVNNSAWGSYGNIPTTAVMGGDFSGLWNIYDPTTQTIATDAKGNSYPVRKTFAQEYGSNTIPTAMFDKLAAAMQSFYPTPANHMSNGHFVNGSTGNEGEPQNNYYSTVPSKAPYHKYFGRLDYDIKPNNRLSMSDTQSDTPQVYPSAIFACPVGCQSGDVDNNNSQVTDVWSISANLINEFRFGYTWQGNYFADLALGKGYPTKLGWNYAKADTLPNIQFYNNYPYNWPGPSSNSVYKEHVFDPSDVVTMIRGKHILHFGGEFLFYRDNSTAWGNTNAGAMGFTGQYTQGWNTDSQGVAHPISGTGLEYADFLLGYMQTWNAAVTPEYGARLKSPQMFVQDDYKVSPRLTVNLGVRYQINHGWNEVHNNEAVFDPKVMNSGTGTLGAMWYASTHANGRKSLQENVYKTVMPRAGFSYLIDAKTTVRGGFGIYSYNWSLDAYGNGMGAAYGSSGSITDSTNGVTPIAKLDGTGVIYGTSTALPYSAASTDPTRFNGQNVSFNQYHTPVPKIYQWNASVQRQLTMNMMAQISYVASRGRDLAFPTDLNQVPESKLSPSDNPSGRPYSGFGAIQGSTNNALSRYNSLQAEITKRMYNGLSFSFNYVWSHMLDDQDSSGWGGRGGPQDYQIANNPKANYSNSNFDIRHAFKGYAVYELPFGKGKMFLNKSTAMDEVFGGWQLSGTAVAQTGNPFTVISTQNTFAQAGSSYPNRNKGVSTKPENRSASKGNWFNPSAFLEPADGTFGNVRRNSIYGPGLQYVNLSGSKTVGLPWEGIRLQIRCDAQNAFNHPSFSENSDQYLGGSSGPGTPYTTGNSQLSTSVNGRNLQLGAHLSF